MNDSFWRQLLARYSSADLNKFSSAEEHFCISPICLFGQSLCAGEQCKYGCWHGDAAENNVRVTCSPLDMIVSGAGRLEH
jgi:hypothetical protein